MAINKQDLHDLLYENLANYSRSDAYKNDMGNPKHLRIMAETMQEYFEDNTEITYGWDAYMTSTPFSPDPVKSFKSTVKFSPWDLSMPIGAEPTEILPGLAAKIMAATSTGVISHAAGFSVVPGSYLVKQLVLPQHGSAEQCLMKCIVEPVCDWMLTLINPAALPGSHTAFAGATTSMVIS